MSKRVIREMPLPLNVGVISDFDGGGEGEACESWLATPLYHSVKIKVQRSTLRVVQEVNLVLLRLVADFDEENLYFDDSYQVVYWATVGSTCNGTSFANSFLSSSYRSLILFCLAALAHRSS